MRKRILIVGVFTLLCILLIGCSAGKGSETTSVTSETLKITENPAIDPTPSPSPKPMPSSWKIDNYVDDFGDKTGSAYLRGEFKGKRKGPSGLNQNHESN